MTLGAKQELFAFHIAHHILWLLGSGYGVRIGDVFRDPRVHGEFGERLAAYGARNSFHKLKLAADLNLTKDGVFIHSTEGHRVSGEKWKSRHDLCTWGGDFKRPDGNHYSFGERRFGTKGGF